MIFLSQRLAQELREKPQGPSGQRPVLRFPPFQRGIEKARTAALVLPGVVPLDRQRLMRPLTIFI